MVKIEKFIEYSFYLLILLYFVGKLFKPITLVIDIAFIFLIIKYYNKEKVILFIQKYKKLIMIFIFFISYLIFQSLVLELKFYTFKSSFETILYIISFFASLYIFDKKEKINKLIFISYFILLIIGLDSLYQYFTGVDIFGKKALVGDFGMKLTAWNDTHKVNLMMGQFFGMLIVTILLFKGKLKNIAIFMLFFCLVIFFISGNRSPILALFTSVIFIGIFTEYKKYLLFFISVFLILFSVSFLDDKLSTAYKGLLNPTTNNTTSYRIPLLLTGVEVIKDNPLLGIGSHNYRYYHKEYYAKVDFNKYKNFKTDYFDKFPPHHAHSVGFDILISYGIFGTLIFLFVLYQIYHYFIKENSMGLISSIGFLYCITPFQFAKGFTQGDWQFVTYLGLVFLALMSQYKILDKKD